MIPPRHSLSGLLTLGGVFAAAAAVGLVIALIAGGGSRNATRERPSTVAASRPAPAFVAPAARLRAVPPPGSGVVVRRPRARPKRAVHHVLRHRPAPRARIVVAAVPRPAPAPTPVAAPAPAPHYTAAVTPQPAPKPAPVPKPKPKPRAAPVVVIDDSG